MLWYLYCVLDPKPRCMVNSYVFLQTGPLVSIFNSILVGWPLSFPDYFLPDECCLNSKKIVENKGKFFSMDAYTRIGLDWLVRIHGPLLCAFGIHSFRLNFEMGKM
jgi:hypothetical protein